jgi:tetratricopeptide (TPR) repeat protein
MRGRLHRFGPIHCLPAVILIVMLAGIPHPAPAQTQAVPAVQPAAVQDALAPSQTAAPPQPDPINITQPQPAPTPEQLGDALMMHHRYQAAIESYKRIPQLSAEVWNKMGISYQMLLNMNEANRCYRMSLKLDPHNAHVLNNLGTIYDLMKQPRAAERMYRQALKADPQAAITYKNLGTNLLGQQKYAKGWDAYKKALAIDPNVFQNTANPRVEDATSLHERGALNYYMARGCAHTGQVDCAIEYLRLALSEGYTTPKKLQADAEFSSLRGTQAFAQLMAVQSESGKPIRPNNDNIQGPPSSNPTAVGR